VRQEGLGKFKHVCRLNPINNFGFHRKLDVSEDSLHPERCLRSTYSGFVLNLLSEPENGRNLFLENVAPPQTSTTLEPRKQQSAHNSLFYSFTFCARIAQLV
jgi:hypothetical protein